MRYFLVDVIGGIVLFPFWWYSKGLLRVGQWMMNSLTEERANLGIGVWMKNLFVPMYGVNDITGRLVSFFMRVVQIVGRTIVLFFYAFLLILALLAYLLLPIFVVYQILFHFVGIIV